MRKHRAEGRFESCRAQPQLAGFCPHEHRGGSGTRATSTRRTDCGRDLSDSGGLPQVWRTTKVVKRLRVGDALTQHGICDGHARRHSSYRDQRLHRRQRVRDGYREERWRCHVQEGSGEDHGWSALQLATARSMVYTVGTMADSPQRYRRITTAVDRTTQVLASKRRRRQGNLFLLSTRLRCQSGGCDPNGDGTFDAVY